MITIYLDQNMWIGLKNAATGSANSKRFAGLPEACREAVTAERCRFVLSYPTTRRRIDDLSSLERAVLARIMLELSHAQTMTVPEVIIRHEVRAALHDLPDLDLDLPAFDPFGWGLRPRDRPSDHRRCGGGQLDSVGLQGGRDRTAPVRAPVGADRDTLTSARRPPSITEATTALRR
ncbi:MAG: hypothetical protein M5U19_10990 [Microthrixaceae bacterium]|nr:hypothetical protein [Microthrixaceae bacterium]